MKNKLDVGRKNQFSTYVVQKSWSFYVFADLMGYLNEKFDSEHSFCACGVNIGNRRVQTKSLRKVASV